MPCRRRPFISAAAFRCPHSSISIPLPSFLCLYSGTLIPDPCHSVTCALSSDTKYRRKRVIFHEASASLTCLLSGLLATNHRTTPPAHPTTSPAPLRPFLAALAASLCLLFSSLATSSSPSLSSSKLLITLAADDLDRFGFGVCLTACSL